MFEPIIAYDPALPFVVVRPITMGGADGVREIPAGESLAWRELGIDEITLHSWWRAGLVRCEAVSEAPKPQPSQTKQRAARK